MLPSWASRSFILRYWAMPLALSRSAMTEEGVAGVGRAFDPRNSDRGRGTGFGDGAAAVVEHGADFAEGVADDVGVAGAEGSVMHRIDATAPRPRSSLASMTVLTDWSSGSALLQVTWAGKSSLRACRG